MPRSYDAVVVGAFGVSSAVVLPPDGRRHGVEVTFTDVLDCVGQAGGDSALGFAALGRRTAAVGHVGDDRPGEWVRAELARAGIDTRGLDTDPAGTARSVNLVAPDGSRTSYYDGRGHLSAPVPDRAAATVASARLALFHLSNWSRHLLPVARAAGVAVAVDLQDLLSPDDPYRRDYAEQADILFFSAANVPDVAATAAALVAGRAHRVVIAGMGARGCAVGTADGIELYPPVRLDRPVVDTNGAGDALAVGFLTAYVLEGRPLEEAAHRGQVAARWVCGQRSSSAPLITAAQLDRLTPPPPVPPILVESTSWRPSRGLLQQDRRRGWGAGMVPPDGEPAAGPWRVVPLGELVRLLLAAAGPPADRPAVLAVGGRSSGGKSTLAGRLAAAIPGAVVVHSDDIAWHHAVLDWDHLLVAGVLEPVRRGEPVSYRPPKWDERGRPGAIEVPAGTEVLIVEGVGATRRALAPLLDATVWVQSDATEVDRRNEVRVAARELTPSDHRAWMAEEGPFLLADRAWERATVIVAGTPELPHDPRTEVVVADPAPPPPILAKSTSRRPSRR